MNPYVLYVDDEPSNLVVFEAGLGRVIPVLTATSGAEALQLLKTHEIAVLLADQRMPEMTGVELMERVRIEFPDVVRFLITAYSDLDATIDAINRGQVDGYFRKPWEIVELRLALLQARERFLAGHRIRDLERRLVATERTYALGVVAAGIAHELRNPITSLSLSVEVAQQVLAEAQVGEEQLLMAKNCLTEAAQAISCIIEITNAMELSTRQREVSDVDVREVVELAIKSVWGDLKHKGRLEKHLGAVRPIRASRTRLGQVVLNLLINATQAIDPAKIKENVIRLDLEESRGLVVLSVSDTGPGIAPELQKKIFDPFFTTKKEGGTGLGLAISRQIVAELGGTIEVESALGQGTTFRVVLPVPASGPALCAS